MNEEIIDDIAIEHLCQTHFRIKFDIKKVIARQIPTGLHSRATIFATAKNGLYVFNQADAPLVLADVRKIIRNMGMAAERFLPPNAIDDYFETYGRQKFAAQFPGRPIRSDEDFAFYCTLAPYNPALVKIGKVGGIINQYNSDAQRWEKYKDYSYSRMRVA